MSLPPHKTKDPSYCAWLWQLLSAEVQSAKKRLMISINNASPCLHQHFLKKISFSIFLESLLLHAQFKVMVGLEKDQKRRGIGICCSKNVGFLSQIASNGHQKSQSIVEHLSRV